MKKSTYTILVTAGRGPHECAFVVAQVWNLLEVDLKQHGCSIDIIDKRVGKYNETYYSVLTEIKGGNIPELCKPWIGTIQWVGQSPFRKNHQRKNWFIGCYLFQNEKPEVINLNDIAIHTFRASGPGGQHRNKVETAVRITHKRLGIVVEATEHRSQRQNRDLAMEKMKKSIKLRSLQEQKSKIETLWLQAITLERGNPIKVFKGKKFHLIK